MFTELGNLIFITFLFKFLILKFEVSNMIVTNGGIHSRWCGEHTLIYKGGRGGGGAQCPVGGRQPITWGGGNQQNWAT